MISICQGNRELRKWFGGGGGWKWIVGFKNLFSKFAESVFYGPKLLNEAKQPLTFLERQMAKFRPALVAVVNAPHCSKACPHGFNVRHIDLANQVFSLSLRSAVFEASRVGISTQVLAFDASLHV